MNYTTQMDAARQGIITKEMEIAATNENMDVKNLWIILQLARSLFLLTKSIVQSNQTLSVLCSKPKSM